VFGAQNYGLPSRFLSEIPPDLTDRDGTLQAIGAVAASQNVRPRAMSWSSAQSDTPSAEFEVLGANYDDRAARTEEWVRAVRSPPDGFSVVGAPSAVPIWMGGNSAKAVRRAALLGDGWHPLWLPSEDYAVARRRILEIRSAEGIEGPFTFSFNRFHQFTDEPADGWPPPRNRPAGQDSAAPQPRTAADGQPGLVGSPGDLINDLRLLDEAGVDRHAAIRHDGSSPLERFAREVMQLA
jgi:alkanesulfonate monooxygenase SsuD/methylene tetrahydromethanopterin reductase-like flavin-dependent oxidoreductase (luciferase family)